jgi:hypothetical protein
MWWTTLALASPPLVPPAALQQQNLANHVLAGHDARCLPEELAKAGRPVVGPETRSVYLASKGIDGAMVASTVDDLRTMVVGWLTLLQAAGDTRISGRELCVGLWDDAKGANSFAAGGRWIYVGVRDLETMAKVHGAGMPATVEYTVGHELGHALQQAEKLAFPGTTARAAELHADCIAGYLMGLDRNPRFSRVGRLIASSEAFRIGDHQHSDPQHHGTPVERQAAFDAGWTAGMAATGGAARTSAGILVSCAAVY